MGRKRTNDEYLIELSKIHKDIVPLEEYKCCHTKILHKCNKCNYEWYASPNPLLRGSGCPNCTNHNTMSQDEFQLKLKSMNKNITVIGKYINTKIKVKVRCNNCGIEWYAFPNSLLRGKYGCKKCSHNSRKDNFKYTNEEFVKVMSEKRPELEVLSEYKGSHSNITVRCKNCGKVYERKATELLMRKYCVCSIPKSHSRRKTHEQYLLDIENKGYNIDVLEKYITSNTKILHRCKICGYEWNITPNDVLQGYGCPRCKESKGEKNILNFLDKNNIKYIRQYKFNDCKNVNPLPFDFAIFDTKDNLYCLIEHQGEQHYKPVKVFGDVEGFNKQVQNDKIKFEYCYQHNIKLLYTNYKELNNIDNILLDYLNPLIAMRGGDRSNGVVCKNY